MNLSILKPVDSRYDWSIKLYLALFQSMIVDQTIEKVSFCAPDRNHEKGFAYICRDGTTRRWMCHGFLAVKESVYYLHLKHSKNFMTVHCPADIVFFFKTWIQVTVSCEDLLSKEFKIIFIWMFSGISSAY